jgi:hypothetical protein
MLELLSGFMVKPKKKYYGLEMCDWPVFNNSCNFQVNFFLKHLE